VRTLTTLDQGFSVSVSTKAEPKSLFTSKALNLASIYLKSSSSSSSSSLLSSSLAFASSTS
jgi:hypothetical protein